jgi:hypothetical protein
MQPLVSILIPAFNAEEWIGDTIRSALRQTWPRKEIVVVDDGSRDATLAIARTFASPEVSVVARPHAGAAQTRNHAFELCHGDYVQWLDADNLLADDKIARQMEVALQSDSKRTLYTSEWARFGYRPHRARFAPTALWRDLSPAEWLLIKLEQNVYMPSVTWLVSRELAEAAGPWDTRLVIDDDGEYFARVLLGSDRVRFVAGARAYRRIRGPGQLSHIGWSGEKLDGQLLSVALTIQHLQRLDGSARTRAACVTLLEKWLELFHPERPDLVAQAGELAAQVGATLRIPPLSWKYAWIGALCGRSRAKWVERQYNRGKHSLLRAWDRALWRLQQRRA